MIQAYCRTYKTRPNKKGLPPYPQIDKTTPQFRAYWRIYKTATRIVRNERGICERCSRPVSEGSVLCDVHRARGSARAGKHGAQLEDRSEFHRRQGAHCPICLRPVDLWASIDHDHGSGTLRGLLHNRCNLLVSYFEQGSVEDLRKKIEAAKVFLGNSGTPLGDS